MVITKQQLQQFLNEKSGHSRRLRLQLRAAREQAGLSLEDTAQLIGDWRQRLAQELDEDITDLSGPAASTISMWERFVNHPNIVDFAAWARVLGYRLRIELDDAGNPRQMVLLATIEAVEIARTVDMMPEVQRMAVLTMIRAMTVAG
jgi:transcriptional regulator with XRE-family HTH domain